MRVSKHLPKVQQQVDRLESAGFDVTLTHDSKYHGTVLSESGVTPYHGCSEVEIIDTNGMHIVGMGVSFCSLRDNFNRVTGTEVAFKRAISDFYKTVGHEKALAVLHPEMKNT